MNQVNKIPLRVNRKTHEQFVQELYIKQPELEVIGKYINTDTSILVKDKYSSYYYLPYLLLRGKKPCIKAAVDKAEYFRNYFKEVLPQYKLVSDYQGSKICIYYEDEFGLCKTLPTKINQKFVSTILSAVDKNSYFINKSNHMHNNKYGYEKYIYDKVNYTKAHDKCFIYCTDHKEYFEQEYNSHVNGNGCPKCAYDSVGERFGSDTEKFIEKSISIHGDKYSYNLVDYKNSITPILLTCNIHNHTIPITPNSHFNGINCPFCTDEKMADYRRNNAVGFSISQWIKKASVSKNFDSFKCYIIRCWNDVEEFYKVGRTFVTIESRFKSKKAMPYNYEILEVIKGSGKYIYNLEISLKRLLKKDKYVPNIKFGGRYECFNKIDFELLNKTINE